MSTDSIADQRALHALSEQLEAQKRYSDLVGVLKQLIQLDPKSPSYFAKLGWAYIELGSAAEAEAAFEQAFRLNGPPSELDAGRGIAAWMGGDHATAISSAKRAVSGGFTKALPALVQMLNSRGETEEALRVVAQQAGAQPANPDLFMLYARQLSFSGRYAEAVTQAQRALSLRAGSLDEVDFLCRIAAAAGEFDVALKILRQRLRAAFESSDMHGLWTDCLLARSSIDEACDTLEAMVRDDPTNAAAAYQLALLLERRGELERAEVVAKQCSALKPKSLLVAGLLGRLLVQRDRIDEAANFFAKVLDATWESVRDRKRQSSATAPQSGLRARPVYPIAYLPVEIGSRELSTRLLIARRLATKGFTVVLLGHSVFKIALSELPTGVILYKSLNGIDHSMVKFADSVGHVVTAIDEEAFGWTGDSLAMMRTLDERNLNHCAALFAPSSYYRERILERVPSAEAIVIDAGNPRTDLCTPAFRTLVAVDAEALTVKFGRTLLFCTNFGTWNSAALDFATMCTTTFRAAGSLMDSDAGRDLLALYHDDIQAECRNTVAFMRALPEVAAAFPTHTIVIRPHPVERSAFFERLAKGISNAVVTNQATLYSQMMAADAVIHFPGCGTGLEARILGRPVISFDTVSEFKFPKLGLSAHVSAVAKDTNTLIETIRRAVNQPAAFIAAGAEHDMLVERHITRSDALVSDVIADHLVKPFARVSAGESGPLHVTGDLLATLNDGLRTATLRSEAEILGNVAAKAKRMTASKGDIVASLRALSACSGESADLDVSSPANGVFVIRKS